MANVKIERIKIHGFKSLKEIDFEMRPLNVLIGPNNGGKTNFLEFLEFLSEAAHEELQDAIARRGGFFSLLYAGYGDSKKAEISCEVDFLILSEKVSYKVALSPDFLATKVMGEWFQGQNLWGKRTFITPRQALLKELLEEPEQKKRLKNGELIIAQDPKESHEYLLRNYLRSLAIYEFSTAKNSPLRREQSLKAGIRISPDGDNLASVLHNMKERGEYRDAYNEIIKTLRVAFPTFKDLHFPCEVSEGKIALRWEGEFKRDFSSAVLSDGVLKFLCLTTLLLSPDPPDLICIDEPEIGLHPQLISLVAELLIAASERIQLIVATHSPQLIERLRPEDVVVEKKDGATELRRLPPEELKSWLKDFTLSELWLTGVTGGR